MTDAGPKQVKVLIVAPSLRILGGQAIQAQRLLERLRGEPELEVDFLAVDPELPPPFDVCERIKYVRTVTRSVVYWAQLLLRTPRYDALHIFSASYWSFLLAPVPAVLAGRLYGKRTILNYRSGEADDHLANWRSATFFSRMFRSVIVPSDYLVGVFARYGIHAEAIPNIVDESFRFRARERLRPHVLANRNLEPMYNVECVIRAFALVAARYPEARLDIVGDGAERARLEALARDLGLTGVVFHGRVPIAAMPGFYDRADLYVNAPDIDNMPSSILEAQTCGLPVATTDAGGIPCVVDSGRTGLMVPRGDHQALAACLLRYLEEPAFAQQIIGQARAAASAYRWSEVREQWVAAYRGSTIRPQ
jgi:glycosyltransferase involved in cell wall biosynthesis